MINNVLVGMVNLSGIGTKINIWKWRFNNDDNFLKQLQSSVFFKVTRDIWVVIYFSVLLLCHREVCTCLELLHQLRRKIPIQRWRHSWRGGRLGLVLQHMSLWLSNLLNLHILCGCRDAKRKTCIQCNINTVRQRGTGGYNRQCCIYIRIVFMH